MQPPMQIWLGKAILSNFTAGKAFGRVLDLTICRRKRP